MPFAEVNTPPPDIRSRGNTLVNYDELAESVQKLAPGKSISIGKWPGSIKGATSSIKAALGKRGVQCKVLIRQKENVFVEKVHQTATPAVEV